MEGTSWNLYCKYAQSVLPAAAAAVRHDDDDLLAAAAAMSNIHIYTGGIWAGTRLALFDIQTSLGFCGVHKWP